MFIRVVHEILHAIYDSKEVSICWVIHVSNDTHSNILNIVVSFNSDVHEATNPVIEGASM